MYSASGPDEGAAAGVFDTGAECKDVTGSLNASYRLGAGGYTQEGLSTIESYLAKIGSLDDPENQMMLERLKEGETGPEDLSFYAHELHESSLVNGGMDQLEAHKATLEWQGIKYEAGYERYLYSPDIIKEHPEWFNPAASQNP